MLRLPVQALSSPRGPTTPSNAAKARRSARRMLAAGARDRRGGAGRGPGRRRNQRTEEQGPAGNDSHPDDRHHALHRIDLELEHEHPDRARDGGCDRAAGRNRVCDLSRRPQSGSGRRRPAGRGDRGSPSCDQAAQTPRPGEGGKAPAQAKPVARRRRVRPGGVPPVLLASPAAGGVSGRFSRAGSRRRRCGRGGGRGAKDSRGARDGAAAGTGEERSVADAGSAARRGAPLSRRRRRPDQ